MCISAANSTATAAPAAHHQIGTQSRSEYSTEPAGVVEGVESPDSEFACSACRSAVTGPRVVATQRHERASVVSFDVSDEVTDTGNEPSVDRLLLPAVPLSEVRVRRLDPDLPVPTRAHDGDAGVDLRITAGVTIAPGERVLVGTGLAIALPLGTVGLVHPRSGLAAKSGLSVVNTPGTIDAGYRGEIKVCLINHDLHSPVVLERGDRVAQLIVQRVELVTFVEVDELDDTVRGAGGHGSTGGHASLKQ